MGAKEVGRAHAEGLASLNESRARVPPCVCMQELGRESGRNMWAAVTRSLELLVAFFEYYTVRYVEPRDSHSIKDTAIISEIGFVNIR